MYADRCLITRDCVSLNLWFKTCFVLFSFTAFPKKVRSRQVLFQQQQQQQQQPKEETHYVPSPADLQKALTDVQEIKRFHISMLAAMENHNLTLSTILTCQNRTAKLIADGEHMFIGIFQNPT